MVFLSFFFLLFAGNHASGFPYPSGCFVPDFDGRFFVLCRRDDPILYWGHLNPTTDKTTSFPRLTAPLVTLSTGSVHLDYKLLLM